MELWRGWEKRKAEWLSKFPAQSGNCNSIPSRYIVAVATLFTIQSFPRRDGHTGRGGAFGILIGLAGNIVDNERQRLATCTSLTHITCYSNCLSSALRAPIFSGGVRLAITRCTRLPFDVRARLSPRYNQNRSVRKSFSHYTRLTLPGLGLIQLAGVIQEIEDNYRKIIAVTETENLIKSLFNIIALLRCSYEILYTVTWRWQTLSSRYCYFPTKFI